MLPIPGALPISVSPVGRVPSLEPTRNPKLRPLDSAPKLTNPPGPLPTAKLVRRASSIPLSLCGWVDGNSQEPWIVESLSTCLFYSDLMVVNGWTTCLNFGQTLSSSCDSSCSGFVHSWRVSLNLTCRSRNFT